MTRLLAELILIVVLCGFVSAQSASRQPAASASVLAFEIADVHASPPTPYPPYLHTGTLVGESYVMRQATMLDMISTAYGLDKKNVQGGPSWLDWDRFDVIAKAPPSTSDGALKQMLQSLLKDRFKLRVHEGSAAVDHLRSNRAGSGRYRHLQPHGLLGRTTYPGDGHSHGTWRGPLCHSQAGGLAWHETDDSRPDLGHRLGLRPYPPHRERPLHRKTLGFGRVPFRATHPSAVALLAVWLPATRASKVDPIEALHTE
jgi:hypothetical protein